MVRRILHISAADGGGGAGRSAYRLHTALRDAGHASRMLVGEQATADADVRPLKRNLAWRAADRACGAVTEALDAQYLFYPSSFGVALDPWFRDADVVQLYNAHGSYFSHTALPLLSRLRPVVWRLSDMWALTGHVTYSFECERWRTGCGSCPHLDVFPPLRRDTTARLWRIKNAVYARSRLTVVSPSTWLERLAKESPLLGRFPVRRIPNGVDLDRFRPVERAEARRRLGLDPDRPLLLFSALDLDDRRKGGALLEPILGHLADLDFDLALAGGAALPLARRARALGRLAEPELALAYAAADVFVLPTLAENLPNSAIESLACGTPTVSFAVGGVPDAVRHLETGWLAAPEDVAGLAAGIRTLLEDRDLQGRLARACRRVAEDEFSRALEAGRFAELYEEVSASRASSRASAS